MEANRFHREQLVAADGTFNRGRASGSPGLAGRSGGRILHTHGRPLMAAEHTKTIAFVGLGQMGRQMAERLAGAGFSLRVWNRTRSRAEGLPNAQVFESAREAAAGAELVLTSLADDRAVREVVLGPDGVIAGLPSGGVHVGTSTISLRLVGELGEAHAARGQPFV